MLNQANIPGSAAEGDGTARLSPDMENSTIQNSDMPITIVRMRGKPLPHLSHR
ncbi:hypothetical protein GCM10007908_27270 [Rhizobium albus]|nr:hypothetical protein GCM10007908_27270 [Rhizobium albus]